MTRPKFLLLQVRNHDDPVRVHEVQCFARGFDCAAEDISCHDLLAGSPDVSSLSRFDVVLVGGSGDYTVVDGGEWFVEAIGLFNRIVEIGKPMFASCWGFQALAVALGGAVETDLELAEIGTLDFQLTAAGREDPLFSPLGPCFKAQTAHQDIVTQLPDNVELLCSSKTVIHQAFRVRGKPIYATQFHPELTVNDLIHRLNVYPEYVQAIAGMGIEEFATTCESTPETVWLLQRFKRTLAV